MATMQSRLRDAGLHGLIADTASALFAGTSVPDVAMPHISDIAAQPISVRAYWLLVDRAVMRSHFLRIAWDRGLPGAEAEGWAERLADMWTEEQARTRVRVEAPALRLRVEVPTTGARVVLDDDLARAEAERLAAEEADHAARGVGQLRVLTPTA